MENLPDVLQGIAALTWPLIIIIVLFLFRANVNDLIESAKSRKFTIKVAGNELTMEEASKQQQNYISDLQGQLVELQKQVEKLVGSETISKSSKISKDESLSERLGYAKRILWVDDNPKNNAFLVQSLEDQGINVVTALSTEDAMNKFSRGKLDRVISDMGRQEGLQFNLEAGLELTRRIRSLDEKIPIIIYTSSRGIRDQRDYVLAAGASNITSSPTELLNFLNLDSVLGNV